MYKAVFKITESKRDGTVLTHQPGSIIPGFEGWTNVTKKALIDHGRVVRASQASAVLAEGLADLAVKPGPSAQELPQKIPTPIVCELCPDKAFASLPGLKLHTTRVHKPKTE